MEDWGQLISFDPGLVLRPSSMDELKDMLEKVHRGELGNGRVRVPGSLHSCSKIVVSATLIDVSALPNAIELDDVLSDLDATSAKYDFWRVNWLQKSDKALLWAATAVPKDQSKPDGDYPTDQSENILEFVFKMLDKLSETGPLLNLPLEIVYHALALFYGEDRATGPLRNMLPVDRRAPLRVAMAEWSFRPQDVQRVIEECQTYF